MKNYMDGESEIIDFSDEHTKNCHYCGTELVEGKCNFCVKGKMIK